MTYTEKHLDQIDANLSRPGRNGGIPRLSEDVTDADLKEAAKDVEMLWQATRLERLQGKLTMLKEYEKQAKEDKNTNVISIRKFRFLLSVAAGVLLMVAVGWFVFSGNAVDKAYIAYIDQPLLNIITERGQDSEIDLSSAMTQYDLGNFVSAVKEFERIDLNIGDNAQVYFGYSLLATGKYEKGIETLSRYINQPAKVDAESKYCRIQGEYLLAVGYLITRQNTEEARRILTRLSVEESDVQIPASLLNELN